MTEQDFVLMSITRITPAMVRDTGAKLEDVQAETIGRLNRVCNLINQDPILLRNGITTGDHKSETHPRGQAIDWAFAKDVAPSDVFKAVLTAGFHGYGIYWNGKVYSYHADTRQSYAFWTAVKSPSQPGWRYGEMLVDPKGIPI
jgi:hypothetical protein